MQYQTKSNRQTTSQFQLRLSFFCAHSLLTHSVLSLFSIGLYERDFYREFAKYLQDKNDNHEGLTDVVDVLNRPKLRIEDIPRALNVIPS